MSTPIDESALEAQLADVPPAVQNCAKDAESKTFYLNGGCDAGVHCPHQAAKYIVRDGERKLPGCIKYSKTIRRKLGLDIAQ